MKQMQQSKRSTICILNILFAILLLAGMLFWMPSAIAETVLTAWNVGKADCLLLQTGSENWLIDTGSYQTWPQVEGWLQEAGIGRLDGVIVTHADKDHAGGCMGLALSSLEIGPWYTSAFCAKYDLSDYPAQEAARIRGTQVQGLKQGDVLPMNAGEIRVLWPNEFSDDENSNSLILLVETEDGRLLLMGDAQKKEEKELLKMDLVQECQVLKAGHHGRDDASGKKFLAACRPDIAIISSDSLREEKTADEDVIERLTKVGAQIYLTEDSLIGVRVTLQNGLAHAELLEQVK